MRQLKRRATDGTRAKILATVVTLGVVGALAGFGTWAAFSSTTSNAGNDFEAGTVVLADNDSDSAMFSMADLKPGDTQTKCITVSYSGSLAASLKLYGTTTPDAAGEELQDHLDVVVTRGSFPGEPPADMACTGFEADAENSGLHDDTLAAYPDSYAAGIADPDASWTAGDSAVYRFQVTLGSDTPNAAQGDGVGQTFTWEARNN